MPSAPFPPPTFLTPWAVWWDASPDQTPERSQEPHQRGRALTIKTRSGDNLMLHKALNMAKPGDVIILSNDGGESYRSLIGEIMFTYLASRGAAGIIIDGPIRDIDAVRKMEMPIYATGTNPAGPYKEGPGEINVPISCGGISINPGISS